MSRIPTKRTVKIIEYIKENPTATTKEVAYIFEVCTDTIHRIVRRHKVRPARPSDAFRKQVWDYLDSKPDAKVIEVSKALGRSWRAVEYHMKQMGKQQ